MSLLITVTVAQTYHSVMRFSAEINEKTLDSFFLFLFRNVKHDPIDSLSISVVQGPNESASRK